LALLYAEVIKGGSFLIMKLYASKEIFEKNIPIKSPDFFLFKRGTRLIERMWKPSSSVKIDFLRYPLGLRGGLV